MRTSELVIMSGEVTIDIKDRRGRLRKRQRERNMIVTAGKNVLRDILLGSALEPQSIAVGTVDAGPSAIQTTLGSEVFRKAILRRAAADRKATFQMLILTSEANGNALTEAGLFNSMIAGAPTMLARVVYGSIQKTSSIQLTYTWDITLS